MLTTVPQKNQVDLKHFKNNACAERMKNTLGVHHK